MMGAVFRKFYPQTVATAAPAADLRRITLEVDPTSDRATKLRSIALALLSAAHSAKCLALVPAQSGNVSWLSANVAYALGFG